MEINGWPISTPALPSREENVSALEQVSLPTIASMVLESADPEAKIWV